jgi:hypothetical protein
LRKRRLFGLAPLIAILLAEGSACRRATPGLTPGLRLLADFELPRRSADANADAEAEAEASAVGGISAVSYEPESGRWLALSDARVSSRFYELDVRFEGTSLRVEPRSVTPLKDERGKAFAEDVLDPEGIARASWGDVLISTEPDTRHHPVEQAKLLDVDPSGRLVRFVDVPEEFLVSGSPPDHGLRHNLGFEAMGLSPDGTRLFVGAEATLAQDGPAAGFTEAGLCRILAYRIAAGELAPEAEYVYPIGPFSREEAFGEQEVSGGLVELVPLSTTRLLSLERVFVRELSGEGRDVTHARIYQIDVSRASNVIRARSLLDQRDVRPVAKELVLDLDDILPSLSRSYPKLDNLEAMGLGPELADGGRALLLVSDDNFRVTQRTQFLLFRLTGL